MIKLCVIAPHGSEGVTIITPGMAQLENVEIVETHSTADYVVTNSKVIASKVQNPEKRLIYIDYTDQQIQEYEGPCALYAKRSTIQNKAITEFAKGVFNISYCIKDATLDYFKTHAMVAKTLQVACMHAAPLVHRRKVNPPRRNPPSLPCRSKVAAKVSEWISNKNVSGHVGHVGQRGRFGRINLSVLYLDMLLKSKFVVTCNPDLWEGDFRLYEALGSGALVFVDTMYSMKYLPNPLKHKKHVIFYDRDNLTTLTDQLTFYLNHPIEAEEIAKCGYTHMLNFYQSKYVMKSIISHAKFASTNQNYHDT